MAPLIPLEVAPVPGEGEPVLFDLDLLQEASVSLHESFAYMERLLWEAMMIPEGVLLGKEPLYNGMTRKSFAEYYGYDPVVTGE